jgi:hypothetical protein
VYIVRQLFRAGEPCSHFRRDTLAQLGKDDASSRALKQSSAALLLELGDLTADMRLACTVSNGNLAQAA